MRGIRYEGDPSTTPAAPSWSQRPSDVVKKPIHSKKKHMRSPSGRCSTDARRVRGLRKLEGGDGPGRGDGGAFALPVNFSIPSTPAPTSTPTTKGHAGSQTAGDEICKGAMEQWSSDGSE